MKTIRNNQPAGRALDPEPLPVLPLLYTAAIVIGIGIVATSCGIRDGVLAAAFAGSILLTRLPRALPSSAVLLIIVAVLGILAGHSAAPSVPVAHTASGPVTRTVTVTAATRVRHRKGKS